MSRGVIRREELMGAALDFGSVSIDLSDYATTGLRIVTVGQSGCGKTNVGLLIAEQLAAQDWQCVLVDPEGEIESLYGASVDGPEELADCLHKRTPAIVVVSAADAGEFIPYGTAILEAADKYRKPIFLLLDEGQLFSTSRRRKGDIGEASDIINQFADRGRKRALDLFLTSTRVTGALSRVVVGNKNLSFIGRQDDPAVWATLAPQFKGSGIGYADLAALEPAEFFCFSRQGIERVRMPMAKALEKVAPRARPAKRKLPSTFSQWDRAMRDIPTARLKALTPAVIALLGEVAGLTSQQMLAGRRALADELEARR